MCFIIRMIKTNQEKLLTNKSKVIMHAIFINKFFIIDDDLLDSFRYCTGTENNKKNWNSNMK